MSQEVFRKSSRRCTVNEWTRPAAEANVRLQTLNSRRKKSWKLSFSSQQHSIFRTLLWQPQCNTHYAHDQTYVYSHHFTTISYGPAFQGTSQQLKAATSNTTAPYVSGIIITKIVDINNTGRWKSLALASWCTAHCQQPAASADRQTY